MKKVLVGLLVILVVVLTVSCEMGVGKKKGTKHYMHSESYSDDTSVGTFKNPLEYGDVISVYVPIWGEGKEEDGTRKSYEARKNITINSVMRGKKALKYIKGRSDHTGEPEEGYEYIVIDVGSTITDAETEDIPANLRAAKYLYVDGEGEMYELTDTYIALDDIYEGDIYNGESTSGTIVGNVKEEGEVLIRYTTIKGTPIFMKVK